MVTLREELWLSVSEDRGLRRIFRSKEDEVTKERGKLHNEELKVLYSLLNIFLVIKSEE